MIGAAIWPWLVGFSPVILAVVFALAIAWAIPVDDPWEEEE